MDGEEGLFQNTDHVHLEQNGSMTDDKRKEAKRACLKIEGQDGYVFKSYSMSTHETLLTKKSSTTSLPPIGAPNNVTSQVDEHSVDGLDQESCDEASITSNNKSPSAEVDHDSLHIKEEFNEMGEGVQEHEKLFFDGAVGPFVTKSNDDDYDNFLSGYSSTLYDVTMDAVTQSLLTSIRSPLNTRKKSPAWNHFCISPRDSTKAICMYCMKEFSRGKNEKDLSTSCLMRHIRRAHPTMLLDCDSASLLPPMNSPNNADLAASIKLPLNNHTSPSTSSTEAIDVAPKEVPPKCKPKAEKTAKPDPGTVTSPLAVNNHTDDAIDVASDCSGNMPKSGNSRRRSAVWKHFYLSPADTSKAVCIHCMNEFSRGKNGKDLGTSCLIRHMWRAHRDIVIEENGQGPAIPPPYTTPPTLLSQVQIQDSVDCKKEPPCTSSSPDTVSDEVPNDDSENMEIKEEEMDSSYHSGQESFDLKCEAMLLSSSPEDSAGGSSRSQDPSSVFQQNKKIMKRLKSEVWHHFMVTQGDQFKALCRYCPCVISRSKRGDFGTSCLMRHLMRRHPDVLKNPKSTSNKLLLHVALTADEEMSVSASDSPASEKKQHTQAVFSKKTSKLWNHFSLSSSDPTKVVCLHCNRTISRGKKTTNLGTSCLFRHMQRFHGHALENKSNLSGDVSSESHETQKLTDTLEACEKFNDDHPVAKKITKLIAEMLALDLQPSTLVENDGLTRLLEYLQPLYCLPTSSYFTSNAIPEMYDSVREVVLTHLKEAEGGIIHFAASIWVSSQTREYLTLTAHWVTFESHVRPQGQDFHCSALLGVSPIDCDYNMVSIQKQLEFLWDTWIVSPGLKIGFTVTDNQAIANVLEDSTHALMHCFGHNVDLIVTEAIKSQRMVQNLLSIGRKICERVHRSETAKEKLAELQKTYNLPENQLIQDIPSKWRTSYFMLERLVEQKQAIDEMSLECNFRELISCDQWEVMQSVCNALKPFEVACREMSNRTATLGQVIPLIHILNRKIDMLFDETMGIDNMLKSLKDAMVTRMSPTLQDPRYTWATLLDPRYKTSLFTEEDAEKFKQELIQEVEQVFTSATATPPLSNGCSEGSFSSSGSTNNKDNLWALMDDVRHKIKQDDRPKSSELAVLEYLEEDILDQSCDPLDYWNLKLFLWPELAKVAVRYAGCPPSIAPAETLFSTSSANCALNQSRPSLENLERLLFLKVNLPLIYFQY